MISTQLVRACTTFYYCTSSWLNKGLVNTSYMNLLFSKRFLWLMQAQMNDKISSLNRLKKKKKMEELQE